MTDPLVGRVLRGRYRIERRLGQGGMGVVYAAVHLELARPVAVKTLTDVVDRTDVDRFRTEALAAASLAHPHIIQVTDFAAPKKDEPAFLVMELLAGESLAKRVGERGALPRVTAVHIALQMLDAIGAAHAARILHRDIKPANVFVLDGADAERPWIKLLDFGVAKMMDDGSRHTTTGTMIGTPAYMAPEQILGERATEATDLYAVGMCLYEMLAGERPFAEKTGPELTTAILKGEPAPLSGIDPELASIVRRSIDRDPKKRFANAADFGDALRASSTRPPARRRWPLFVAVTVATAATGVGALLLMPHRAPVIPNAIDGAIDATATAVDASGSEAPAEPVEPVTSASTSPSPSAGRTASVLSVCADGDRPLCTREHWECECRTGDGFVVFDRPEENRGTYVTHPPDAKSEGTLCRGWLHGSVNGAFHADPNHGTWKCRRSCNSTDIRADRKMAVPGTACTGILGEKAVQGKWRLWIDP